MSSVDTSQRSDSGSETSFSYARGCIDRIEVLNFKSYRGHQVIGPFRNFTAVIGPNGAGKSNLMDCISFVLAVKTTQLRGNQLKDLIYKGGGTTPQNAYVRMVYKHGSEGQEETEFYRGIHHSSSSTGASEYRINNKVVSLQEYEKGLATIGVLVKVRNFLVFQGEVEALAQTSPIKLSEVVEKISGSGALKDDYDALKANKDKIEEESLFSLQRKKGLQSEKKQVMEQKAEADHFENLKQDHDELLLTQHLFELFFTEKEINTAKERMSELQDSLEEIRSRRNTIDSKIKDVKKADAGLNRKMVQAEKDLGDEASELDTIKAHHIKLKEEIAFMTRRLETASKNAEKAAADAKKQKIERQRVEHEIADVESRIDSLQTSAAGDDIQLADHQLDQYTKCKEQANQETYLLRQVLDGIERDQKNNRQELHNLQVSEAEARHREEQAEKQKQELEQRRDKLVLENKQRSERVREMRREEQQLKADEAKNKQQERELRAHLERIHEQLRDARVDRREAERDEKTRELVASLQRLFAGVYGRVIDLCKPTQSIYNVPVTVAIGKDIDSIVVDTEETGRQCVQYLREQRAGIATFIPLDTIKAKPVSDALRTLGGSAKLAIDVMEFDKKYEKAMLYVFGETLVFDTLDEARKVCLKQAQRRRGVTLDGTKIDKSGVMTGGISGVEQKAARWDQQQLDELKKERERCERTLLSLSRQRLSDRLNTLTGDMEGLGKASQLADADIQEVQERLRVVEATLTAAHNQLRSLTPRMDTLQAILDSREQRIASLKQQVSDREDAIFADFSRSLGLQNFREYETRVLSDRTMRAEELGRLTTQLSKLQSKLEYDTSTDRSAPIQKLQADTLRLTEQLATKKEEEKTQSEAMGSRQSRVDAKIREVSQLRVEREAKRGELNELKKQGQSDTDREVEVTKALTALETRIERLRSQRLTTLHHCRMEDVPIPLTHDATEQASQQQQQQGGRKRRRGEKLPPTQMSESFSFSESQATSTDTEQQQQLVQIDFSGLADEYRNAGADKHQDMLRDLQSRIKVAAENMAQMAPNLKASDKLDEVDLRLKDSNEEWDQSRQKARDAAAKFNQKKEQRYRLFMRAFNHISRKIDSVYKELTKTPGVNVGGTAYLTLENIEEPYLAGIKYNAMPPMKRFRDMEQLSGGEKTVAAVALLFAIHSFHPSPFFVLDEVDAALDHDNVNKVASYIASRSGELQCIVISLKDTFYDKAQSLVGIYRDQAQNCSKTLAMDLTEYDP